MHRASIAGASPACGRDVRAPGMLDFQQVIQPQARKHRRPQPIVVQKRLEAGVALALVYQRVVIDGDAGGEQQSRVIKRPQLPTKGVSFALFFLKNPIIILPFKIQNRFVFLHPQAALIFLQAYPVPSVCA